MTLKFYNAMGVTAVLYIRENGLGTKLIVEFKQQNLSV